MNSQHVVHFYSNIKPLILIKSFDVGTTVVPGVGADILVNEDIVGLVNA